MRRSEAGPGPSRVIAGPKWVPNEDEVLALFDVVPQRYLAALWLGAGQGCLLGEALGIEDGDRSSTRPGALHMIQQLRYSPQAYGGFYLCEPKAGSSGSVDLDPIVAEVLAEHVSSFPPVGVELIDITSGEPVRRRDGCCSPRHMATRLRTEPGRASGPSGVTPQDGPRSTAASTRFGTSSPQR